MKFNLNLASNREVMDKREELKKGNRRISSYARSNK
jgi:hypothetical protein